MLDPLRACRVADPMLAAAALPGPATAGSAQSGRSSGVEHNHAKVGVEGSNPFARSSFSPQFCGAKLRLAKTSAGAACGGRRRGFATPRTLESLLALRPAGLRAGFESLDRLLPR